MQNLTLSDHISSLLPSCRLGLVTANVVVDSPTEDLQEYSKTQLSNITELLQTKEIHSFTQLLETRQAYKLCGKEPSRYRPSAEALLRRIKNGKGLYSVNNVVDVINLLSIQTTFSIGGFNLKKIVGAIKLDIGNAEPYLAIGRGELNIEHMPALRDQQSFFGTPTSDSQRTMITNDTKELLLVFYDFFGNSALQESLSSASKLLEQFCRGTNISIDIQ